MGIKIKFKTQIDAPKQYARIQKEFARRSCSTYKRSIIRSMKDGKSPVRRKRWVKYSQSYIRAILTNPLLKALGKRIRPVNLKVSGELWRSLECTTKGTQTTIAFTDFLADIHNRQGASRKKVIRRMLPTNDGELFNLKITGAIQKLLTSIVNKHTAN